MFEFSKDKQVRVLQLAAAIDWQAGHISTATTEDARCHLETTIRAMTQRITHIIEHASEHAPQRPDLPAAKL